MITEKPDWHFIINSAAAGGRVGALWREWMPKLKLALPSLTFALSSVDRPVGVLVREAVRRGHSGLVGVGGDGTHHYVLNELVALDALGKVIYAPLSLGSGNDWVRTLSIPTRLPAWLAYLRSGRVRNHSVGSIRFVDTGTRRTFLNVAGFAYDAEVVREAEGLSAARSRWMYPLLAARYLRRYDAPAARIDYDGNRWEGPVHTINVGIGRYSGGGMSFVPHAKPFGELLALTVAKRMPVWKVLANSWRFYTGSIASVSGVTTGRAKAISITPLHGRLECEADGEWLGEGEVIVDLHVDRLRVWVPAGGG